MGSLGGARNKPGGADFSENGLGRAWNDDVGRALLLDLKDKASTNKIMKYISRDWTKRPSVVSEKELEIRSAIPTARLKRRPTAGKE